MFFTAPTFPARLRRQRPYRRSSLAFTLVCLLPLAAGCGRSPQDHARFAKAGATYAAALDDLLVAAGNLSIDKDSALLLQARKRANAPLSDQTIKAFADIDNQRGEAIGRLRTHARLLARYFGLLNDLATSDAPERAGKAAEGAAAALSKVGNELRASSLANLAEDKPKLSAVTRLIVSTRIRGQLNGELSKRQETIRRELQTQEELLKALAKDINQDVSVLTNVREDLLVNNPLQAGVPPDKVEDWITTRRMVLTAPSTIKELNAASADVEELQTAFEELVTGKVNRERMDAVLVDFEALLSVAETLKSTSGGKK